MNDKPELKPCPFCGGEACCSPSTESDEPEREDREPLLWGVGCGCTAFVGPWSTEAEAIAAWNTRATSQPDASALVDVLAKHRPFVVEQVDAGVWSLVLRFGNGSESNQAMWETADAFRAALTAWEAQHG